MLKKLDDSRLVLAIDILLALFSLFISYQLRFNFAVPHKEVQNFSFCFILFIVIRLITFGIFRIQNVFIRFVGIRDAMVLFISLLLGSGFMALTNLGYLFIYKKHLFPFSVLIIELIFSAFFLLGMRIVFRFLYLETATTKESKKFNLIIFGAGEAGITTKRAIDRNPNSIYQVVAMIDDNEVLHKKKIDGVNVYGGAENLEQALTETKPDYLLLSVLNLPVKRKNELVEICLNNNIKVLNIPHISKWINGELSVNQLRSIKIDDLLEREPIVLDELGLRSDLYKKTVLITGAAGSIGSELARQVCKYQPQKLVLLDQAESALYELENELKDTYHFHYIEIVLGDVRNDVRMRKLFQHFMPQVVFHAAAYKHVPMMENNPSESIRTNVLGTKIIADLCNEFKIERCVLISTDKAVNPTNIMGCSKRIAELYVQSLQKATINSNTKFITTRFGNVLGSSGSVIPLFKKQIDNGGPVTITHKDITRFFMTIPEACQLVLEASHLGNGGEIFIFDMGERVKIIDLAKKMIRLSGLQLGTDIQIHITGLRPGEKLHEELLNDTEKTLPTPHEKIMIAKVIEQPYTIISKQVDELISLFDQQDNMQIVALMKAIVPEYKSNNSVYEMLDND